MRDPEVPGLAATAHARPRLAHTRARARWGEYRRLLEAADAAGYRIVSLEAWLDEPARRVPARVLVLRHDIDQHARSALPMAAIEEELGLSSTWYVRWRTARPAVVERLRERGGAIGLHYETLSRRVRQAGIGPGDVDAALLERCRAELAAEIATFAERFGQIRSICPHGDSRVAFVDNATLVRGRDVAQLGVRWDGREAMAGRGLRHWLTDACAPQGGWTDGADPYALLRSGSGPILCLTHPNNWVSGLSLWGDRLLRRACGVSDAPPPADA